MQDIIINGEEKESSSKKIVKDHATIDIRHNGQNLDISGEHVKYNQTINPTKRRLPKR